jgi:hypothetical protein
MTHHGNLVALRPAGISHDRLLGSPPLAAVSRLVAVRSGFLIPLPFYFPILQHVFLDLPGCGLARKMLDILAPILELAVLPDFVRKILSLTLNF